MESYARPCLAYGDLESKPPPPTWYRAVGLFGDLKVVPKIGVEGRHEQDPNPDQRWLKDGVGGWKLLPTQLQPCCVTMGSHFPSLGFLVSSSRTLVGEGVVRLDGA